jgi:NADH-quinone oxidoreductase subunit L
VAIGALGLVLGFRATLGRPILPARQAPADHGFALVLNRKYYVDELYDALFVRPIAWLSRVVLWRGVDQGLVDGAAVNGAAWASRLAGSGLRLLQTGQVGIYVVLFLVGALWILRAVIR